MAILQVFAVHQLVIAVLYGVVIEAAAEAKAEKFGFNFDRIGIFNAFLLLFQQRETGFAIVCSV